MKYANNIGNIASQVSFIDQSIASQFVPSLEEDSSGVVISEIQSSLELNEIRSASVIDTLYIAMLDKYG